MYMIVVDTLKIDILSWTSIDLSLPTHLCELDVQKVHCKINSFIAPLRIKVYQT